MGATPDRHVIGLISDTHGLLRAGVHQALAGVGLILHAGDVGGHEIVDELKMIAPVKAVHGNVDPDDDPTLPPAVTLEVGGLMIHMSHGNELGSPTPQKLFAVYAADVIVYGHTHRALVQRSGSRLTVNPGGAGPLRFGLPPSVAVLTIVEGEAEVDIIEID
ncbi:MAG TPA: metallophosphoesterase family protein [Gemmatimonadaceae bacterium]|jgi:putative phosphoesterase|nr:metallophosphoesterase family protein [Gemmatimonadaceae bacterium]